MNRFLPRLAVIAALALSGSGAIGQSGPIPAGVPTGTAGPPGGLTEGVTGNTPGMADQVDEMNRHIRERGGNSAAHVDRARPATAADVIAGAAVNDRAGVQLGTIESVDASGAVILTSVGRARIPIEAFGKNSHGLLLQTTKAQFDASVAQANATPS